MFLPAILIPACVLSSPAFLMMYSAYKLISRVTICSLDILHSQFVTSMLSHVQFQLLLPDLHTDFSEEGQVVWYSNNLKNFPSCLVIQTVKGFGIVNKAEIDDFLEFSCFIDDARDVGNLISGSSAFSKSSLNIWKFSVHVLLKPGLENFDHYFASM